MQGKYYNDYSHAVYYVQVLMLHSHKHIAKIHKRKKGPWQYIVLFCSVFYPLSTLPQVIEIYANKAAQNVSLETYLFYTVFSIIFLAYGISEKLKPIITLQALWLVVYCLVIVGILIYK